MKLQTYLYRLLLGISISIPTAMAQSAPPQPVQWKAAVSPRESVKAGDKSIIELTGQVLEGWHVYALSQPAGGPTALSLTLAGNDIAQLNGQISGTGPTKKYDESFQLETELYLNDFTLRVPIEVQHPSAGKQVIPLNVRFQACNDRVCLSPRTIHLSVPIEVIPGAN